MKNLLLVLFFLLYINFSNSILAQNDFPSPTLFSSVGFTVAETEDISWGNGFSFGIGYQRNIFSNSTNNRLRFVPSLSFGGYRSTHAHFADAYYSSYNLKTNINFDIIRIKSFSVFLGTGVTLNYMNGYVGTGGYPDDPNTTPSRKNYYFDDTNFAINGMVGFRLNPKGKRLGYELKLLEFNSVPNRYGNISEFTPIAIRLLFHLK
jgi:hypothetical protein